jgi:hypothetical protein
MTRAQLWAAPKVARRSKERLDRGLEALSAARIRAAEIAQQRSEPPRLIPTASHRRRLVRLKKQHYKRCGGARDRDPVRAFPDAAPN